MKVSAIIPTFNRANLIERAIDSILNQTYKNIEIIVVDDGSTDNTIDILNKYKTQIKVISQQNTGTSAAKNTGIKNSSGEIIMFLDSDDEWLPTKVEKQVRILTSCGDKVTCCLANTILKEHYSEKTSFALIKLCPQFDSGIWLNPSEILTTRFLIFTQAVAVWKSVLDKIGGFDTNLNVLEDFEFAFKLSLTGSWAYLSEPLAIWHNDTVGSLSDQATADNEKYHRTLRSIFFLFGEKYDRSLSKNIKKDLKNNIKRAELYTDYYRSLKYGKKNKQYFLALAVKINKLHEAIRRRLPWFPKMKVIPVKID